jgi:hypothetical protein
MNLSPTLQHALLDFLSAVVAGALLSAAQYLLNPGPIDWKILGAAVLTGAVLAARKWLQAEQLPALNPPDPTVVAKAALLDTLKSPPPAA